MIATVAPPNRCFTLFAAASLANALHWNSTTSALLISLASVVALTLMARSPPTPTMRMPFCLDRRDVLGPGVDQRDVEPAFGEQAAEQAAHRAGADHDDFRILE